jgi:hypothetical protein
MKKIFFLLLLTGIAGMVHAQSPQPEKARINGYANYVFDDKFDSYYDAYNYYNGKIKGGFQWGIGAEFMLKPMYGLELMYLNQSTTAPTTYQGGIGSTLKTENFDMNIGYLLLGGNRYLQKPGSKVEGFGGLGAGIAFLSVTNPSNNNKNSATKFGWTARLGANIWASERFGIKLQTQILSIAQGFGGGLYFGTGGAGAGVSTYSSIYQFVLGGGITFKVGQ